jgi:hypothetical protein
MRNLTSALVAGVAACAALPAMAGVFVEGSSFAVSGSNAPGTVNATATISDGASQVLSTTGGPLNLIVNETPVASPTGAEWISFSYSASPSIAGNTAANWNLNEVGLQTNTATNFIGSFLSFDANGVTQTPTSCGIFGGNFTVAPSPVPGSGTGCLATGFSVQNPAGPLGSLGTFINPFSFLSATGINPTGLTSYFEALEFAPQSVTPPSVPEPASLALLASGLIGLGAFRKRRHR